MPANKQQLGCAPRARDACRRTDVPHRWSGRVRPVGGAARMWHGLSRWRCRRCHWLLLWPWHAVATRVNELIFQAAYRYVWTPSGGVSGLTWVSRMIGQESSCRIGRQCRFVFRSRRRCSSSRGPFRACVWLHCNDVSSLACERHAHAACRALASCNTQARGCTCAGSSWSPAGRVGSSWGAAHT